MVAVAGFALSIAAAVPSAASGSPLAVTALMDCSLSPQRSAMASLRSTSAVPRLTRASLGTPDVALNEVTSGAWATRFLIV
jgi:hypothetical protein